MKGSGSSGSGSLSPWSVFGGRSAPAAAAEVKELPSPTSSALPPFSAAACAGLCSLFDVLSARGLLRTEGIYRVPGDGRRAQEIADLCAAGAADAAAPALRGASAADLASAVKLLLRTHEPVVPYESFGAWTARDQGAADYAAHLLRLGDAPRRRALHRLLSHMGDVLRPETARFNRMTPDALATCIGVNVFRRSENAADMMFSVAEVRRTFERMVELRDDILSIAGPPEALQSARNSPPPPAHPPRRSGADDFDAFGAAEAPPARPPAPSRASAEALPRPTFAVAMLPPSPARPSVLGRFLAMTGSLGPPIDHSMAKSKPLLWQRRRPPSHRRAAAGPGGSAGILGALQSAVGGGNAAPVPQSAIDPAAAALRGHRSMQVAPPAGRGGGAGPAAAQAKGAGGSVRLQRPKMLSQVPPRHLSADALSPLSDATDVSKASEATAELSDEYSFLNGNGRRAAAPAGAAEPAAPAAGRGRPKPPLLSQAPHGGNFGSAPNPIYRPRPAS